MTISLRAALAILWCAAAPAAPEAPGAVRRVLPSFEAFMRDAVYDEKWGSYAADRVSPGADFTTVPAALSPHFGAMVADRCATLWAALGRPAPFALVELLSVSV